MSTIRVSEPVPGVLVEEGLRVHPSCAKHFSRLVGRRITNVQLQRDTISGSHHPLIALVFDDDSSATVLCDPEGNGPGHLGIDAA